jgi:hypothetical protein
LFQAAITDLQIAGAQSIALFGKINFQKVGLDQMVTLNGFHAAPSNQEYFCDVKGLRFNVVHLIETRFNCSLAPVDFQRNDLHPGARLLANHGKPLRRMADRSARCLVLKERFPVSGC